MDGAKLIKMANQIGTFFEAMPDRVQAIEDVASHIQKNWEPRMKRAFLAHLQAQGHESLLPIVREAVPALQA